MRTVIAASVVGMVVLVFSLVNSVEGQQNPPSGPVTVVNTNTNPVPVRAPAPLPISGSVAVTGTSNVNVTNAVLPVSVTNTPTVNVNSSATKPLLVQSINAPAPRFPFQLDGLELGFDNEDNQVEFTVPIDQLWEITFVSANNKLGLVGQDVWCRMETQFHGNVATHWLDDKDVGAFAARQRRIISQPVVAYADPGSVVRVICTRNIAVDFFDIE